MKKILFILLAAISFNSHAFLCKTNTGAAVSGGTQSILDVPIESDIYAAPNRVNEFADIDEFMTCWNEAPGTYVDYLRLNGATPGPSFSQINGLEGGVALRGTYLSTPFTGADYEVFTLRTATEPLPLKLYIKVNSIPTSSVLIKKGDLLITLYLTKYATMVSDPAQQRIDERPFIWELYAGNDVIIGTGTCDINDNQIIEIDFGQVGISGIGTSGATSSYRRDEVINYTCADKNVSVPIKMYFVATPAQFSNNLMQVRIGDTYYGGNVMPGLGVELSREGKVISPDNGSWVSEIVNGIGSDTITLSLVKKNSLVAGDIVEGPFNAAGTIIMSTP